MGVVAMKTLKGAKHKGLLDFQSHADSYTQAALAWALANQDVSCAVISFFQLQHVDEYLAASGKRLTDQISPSSASTTARSPAPMWPPLRRVPELLSRKPPDPRRAASTAVLRGYGWEKEGIQRYAALAKDASGLRQLQRAVHGTFPFWDRHPGPDDRRARAADAGLALPIDRRDEGLVQASPIRARVRCRRSCGTPRASDALAIRALPPPTPSPSTTARTTSPARHVAERCATENRRRPRLFRRFRQRIAHSAPRLQDRSATWGITSSRTPSDRARGDRRARWSCQRFADARRASVGSAGARSRPAAPGCAGCAEREGRLSFGLVLAPEQLRVVLMP